MAQILKLSRARLLLCDCTGTMSPDAAAIRAATGLETDRVCTHLCRKEIKVAEAALESGDPVIIACGQEAETFEMLAEDLGTEANLTTVDIRDRAGWGEGVTGPKMAALVAAARMVPPPVPAIDVESDGICLVYGPVEVAMDAAMRLSSHLTVTALITEPAGIIEPTVPFDVATGRIVSLSGSLARFAVEVNGFADLEPAGRGEARFGTPVDGARSECDILVDLSGGRPLVPADHKRDGYLRADPADPLALERVLLEATQLVGTFEKPLHVRVTESLCAHSRAGQTGCTRCLSVCPTGAITPDGDHITIDTGICAGCGACAAVCPSGSAASEEPPVAHLFRQMRVMAEAYRAAGGIENVGAPRLLVHDDHGAEMIRLAARHGRGLPADVIPLEVAALAGFGHAEQLAAIGLGYASVTVLPAPRTERDVLQREMDLARAIVDGAAGDGADRLLLLEEVDPDAAMETLHDASPAAPVGEPILASGGRRETVRLAARALAGDRPEAPLPLPEGAPYGTVVVDTNACTLCLACAGLCPTGALGDNPDRPELTFREEACIQCGLCAGLCPETAITLVPQLDLSDAVLAPRVLNEEEPFECIACGKPFGVKSTVERITEKLAGSHSMFAKPEQVQLIQMCDDCRVRAQFHADDAPFKFGERPKVRTTEDYLAERDADEKSGGEESES